MACWTQFKSWVEANFPEAEPQDVARHAVTGMLDALSQLGGDRRYYTAQHQGSVINLPIASGLRITQVYSVRYDGCCIPYKMLCKRNSSCAPYFDANDQGVVELYNVGTTLSTVEIEYGVTLLANAINCELDDELFARYAPAVSEWIKANLAAGRSHRSARRMSQDHLVLYTRALGVLRRDITRDHTNRQFAFEGTYI